MITNAGSHRLPLSVFRTGGIALILTLGACISAPCGSDDLTTRTSPTERTIVVGESFVAHATILGCGGKKQLRDEITWSALDTTVIQVEEKTGKITGLAPGHTVVEWKGSTWDIGWRIPVEVSPSAVGSGVSSPSP